jgi:hypothetical protein
LSYALQSGGKPKPLHNTLLKLSSELETTMAKRHPKAKKPKGKKKEKKKEKKELGTTERAKGIHQAV